MQLAGIMVYNHHLNRLRQRPGGTMMAAERIQRYISLYVKYVKQTVILKTCSTLPVPWLVQFHVNAIPKISDTATK
jgi:hypothetical protein